MRLSFILFLIFFSSFIWGHKDTGIKLGENGELLGLPTEYSPAFFKFDNSYLIVAKNKLEIPECITKYFVNSDLYFSSSWYHTRNKLPPYLNIIAIHQSKNIEYTFMFNLDTLELIKGYSFPKKMNVAGVRYSMEPIGLSSDCLKNLKNSSIN